jgi:outer membrane protein assembly factor BamE
MRKLPLTAAVLSLGVALAGCGVIYRQPIYQGNLIDDAAVKQLQVGMSRQQVQVLLGSPSIADAFHKDRWDYTATERTGRSSHIEVKNFTVWFQDDVVTRWEGDYFPKDDEALAVRMGKFGNLSKDDDKKK